MKLSDVVESWPPKSAAGRGPGGTDGLSPELSDVVLRARVDANDCLVLNLSYGAVSLHAVARVQRRADTVRRAVAGMAGRTVHEVGDLVLSS